MRYASAFALTAAIAATAGCTTLLPTQSTAAPRTTDDFCVAAQTVIVAAKPVARNEVHTVLDAFVKSKPVARPLVTTQYVWRESAAAGGGPMMVSCKMKTADHLVAEYGADAAGTDITCRGLNEITLQQVVGSMSRAERRRLRFPAEQVKFDEDLVTTLGPVWLEPYAIARRDDAGHLRLQSKSMRNDWLDPRYAQAPPQFRGTRYCHLVAPEYLRRLLRGEVEPGAVFSAS